MEKITHQMRREQWSKIISECLASGLPKTTWYKQNGISDKAFLVLPHFCVLWWKKCIENSILTLYTFDKIKDDSDYGINE